MTTTDRIAIVTGTSSGIGAALAAQLLSRGWDVLGVARRTPAIADPRYRHLALDVSDVPATVAAFEREVAPLLRDARWRRVALVNNAAVIGKMARVPALGPRDLLDSYAANVAVPTWLMGFVVGRTPEGAALRIVNVSSGAAVHPVPGLAEYCGSKAALRMTGMVLAAELDARDRPGGQATDVAILSYAPGTVDTPMQAVARSQSPDVFPSAGMFRGFAAQGELVPPTAPAAEIVRFLESAREPRFAERRLGA